MNPQPLNILLADDDKDDCFLFGEALSEISLPTHLTTVSDGVKLMEYLAENSQQLPDVLFLDMNMPRRNGYECLIKIRQNEMLNPLPIIMYSTYLLPEIADSLYNNGAHYYIRKADFSKFVKVLHGVLTLLAEKNISRPPKEHFEFTGD